MEISDRNHFISFCPFWKAGRRGRRLNQLKGTRSPLGLLPALGESALEGSKVVVLMDVILFVLVELNILSFSISR